MVDEQGRPTVDDNEMTQGAWHEARTAALALRDVLRALNLAEEFRYLSADVNVFGSGIVQLGRISPAGAQRLAELLSIARDTLERSGELGDRYRDES